MKREESSNGMIGSFETIEEELDALRVHIASFRHALNDEAVWLFLATLGCWGVPNHALQFVAFIVAVFLFGYRLSLRQQETRSARILIEAISERITEIVPEGDSRKARLYDLAELRKQDLSTLAALRGAKVFVACWIFYGVSLAWSFCLFFSRGSV